ncbi:hypothetical protein SCHPADRAFT_897531, partial [Schizopora paradoxa]
MSDTEGDGTTSKANETSDENTLVPNSESSDDCESVPATPNTAEESDNNLFNLTTQEARDFVESHELTSLFRAMAKEDEVIRTRQPTVPQPNSQTPSTFCSQTQSETRSENGQVTNQALPALSSQTQSETEDEDGQVKGSKEN